MKTAAVAAGLAVIAGAVALQGFVIMLLLDGLNAHVSDSVPAVGYAGSVLLGVALSFFGQFFRTSK